MANYCPICGSELVLGDNQMLSDIIGNDEDNFEDTMVTFAHCPHCHCEIEMTDAKDSEAEYEGLIGSVRIYRRLEEDDKEE